MKKLLFAIAFVIASVSQASAFHCPKDMAAIDAALPNATLSAADMAKVKKLRAEGEALHKAKKHAESVKVLGEAMKMLGIKTKM